MGYRTLVWVYRIFGRWVFRLFLRPVVSYYFITGRIPRDASREYLRRLGRCFPELNLSGGWWESYRHFLSFGEILLDKIIVWTGSIAPNQVDFPNRKLLLDLLEQKRGAMLLSGHVGNLEICQAIANLRGHIHLNILIHTKHAEKFNRLLGGSGGSATIQLIEVTELNPAIAIELQNKIERGEFLVLVGDRIPVNGNRTVRTNFFGKEAEFPQGPYLLASLLRCPVYTLFCFSVDGRFHIDLELFAESIRIPRTEPQRTADVRHVGATLCRTARNSLPRTAVAVVQFFSVLERAIRNSGRQGRFRGGSPMIRAEVELTVPFHDVDMLGIAWHGHFCKYLEIVRCEMLEKIDYSYRVMMATGYVWPIVDLQLRFVHPARFGQRLRVAAELVEWEYRMKIKYLIVDAETS